MLSSAKSDWSTFLRQKRRHLSTAFVYQSRHKFLLALYGGSLIVFYLLTIIFLFSEPQLALLVFVLIQGIKWSVAAGLGQRLNFHEVRFRFPAYEALYVAYLIVLTPLILFKPFRSWN